MQCKEIELVSKHIGFDFRDSKNHQIMRVSVFWIYWSGKSVDEVLNAEVTLGNSVPLVIVSCGLTALALYAFYRRQRLSHGIGL